MFSRVPDIRKEKDNSQKSALNASTCPSFPAGHPLILADVAKIYLSLTALSRRCTPGLVELFDDVTRTHPRVIGHRHHRYTAPSSLGHTRDVTPTRWSDMDFRRLRDRAAFTWPL